MLGYTFYSMSTVTSTIIYTVKVIRPDGSETEPHELGNIVVKQPLPPGFAGTLYRNHERFEEYFSQYPVSHRSASEAVHTTITRSSSSLNLTISPKCTDIDVTDA